MLWFLMICCQNHTFFAGAGGQIARNRGTFHALQPFVSEQAAREAMTQVSVPPYADFRYARPIDAALAQRLFRSL